MNDIFCLQFVALRDFCFTCTAAMQRFTFCQKLRPRRPMNGTIYTAAPKQGCIGGIDNRICFRLYNITFYNRQTFHFAIPLCQIPLSHHFILFLKIRKAIFQKKLSNSYIFAHFSQKNKPNPKFSLFCFHSAVFIFSIGFCGSPFCSMAKIRCSPSATPYFVGAATVPIRCPCFTLSPSLTATASAS